MAILKNVGLWQVEASQSLDRSYFKHIDAWVVADSFDEAVSLFKQEHDSDDKPLFIHKCFKLRSDKNNAFELIYSKVANCE